MTDPRIAIVREWAVTRARVDRPFGMPDTATGHYAELLSKLDHALTSPSREELVERAGLRASSEHLLVLIDGYPPGLPFELTAFHEPSNARKLAAYASCPEKAQAAAKYLEEQGLTFLQIRDCRVPVAALPPSGALGLARELLAEFDALVGNVDDLPIAKRGKKKARALVAMLGGGK